MASLSSLKMKEQSSPALSPARLPGIPSLKVLVLSVNLLPPSLRYPSLSQNSTWDPIDSLELLSELAYLDLSMNWFGGPVPASLFRSSLSSMLLQQYNFSGELPATIDCPDLGSYGSGSVDDLSHNCLMTELIIVLAGVESLYLNNSHLTGAVPTEYVESLNQGRTWTLFLQHNYLTGFRFDKETAFPDRSVLPLVTVWSRPSASRLVPQARIRYRVRHRGSPGFGRGGGR